MKQESGTAVGKTRSAGPRGDDQLQIVDAGVEKNELEVRIGRDEMNLAEFPFTVLTHRAPRGINAIKFQDVISGKDGKAVIREWTVTGSEGYGLPVAGDEEVYVALMEITQEHGFRSAKVPITRYDLLGRMGWPRDGHAYRRVQDALNRLMGVSIVANNSFWDNEAKRYVDEGFHILEGYRLYDEKPGRDCSPPDSYVVWNPVLFTSFRAGNIKQLDTSTYFALETPLARRLFRYLDKKRYDGKATYRMRLKKLAFEKLGMSRNYYPSQIKRELERAHAELIEKGFLREVSYYVPQRRGGEEIVIYAFGARKRHGGSVETVPPADSDVVEEGSLHARLIGLGVSRSMAAHLLANYAEHHIHQWVTYCEYKLAHGWLPHESPAAWVVAAIRSRDWQVPEWFEQQLSPSTDAADDDGEMAARLEAQRQSELDEYERIRATIEIELGIGETTKRIWAEARNILAEREQMTPALLSTYLLPIRGRTATLVTPVPFFCQYIERSVPAIAEILRDLTGKPDLCIEISCHEHLSPPHQSRLDWTDDEG